MEIITSIDNSKVRKIASLAEKKYRDALSLYVVEGIRWIKDALKKNDDLIELIAVKKSSIISFDSIIAKQKHKAVVFEDYIFDKISLVKNSQGILAVLKIPKKSSELTSSHSLFLDKIRDPGNMGTIIRSACAAGYNQIICNGCVDVYNPKVIRSSMSAILDVDIIYGSYELLAQQKSRGVKIVAADMCGENIFGITELPDKLCLIIGGEADGVSKEALKYTDLIASIPMQNIESLNAAVSASILMYFLNSKAFI